MVKVAVLVKRTRRAGSYGCLDSRSLFSVQEEEVLGSDAEHVIVYVNTNYLRHGGGGGGICESMASNRLLFPMTKWAPKSFGKMVK
ncbi:uncharacterized protein J3R85_000647 [Psidium guajava]|nr:uncharacterized protein J3R85_000647 [Psidium guajava]